MDRHCTIFWIEAHADPVILKAALRVLIPVAASYICDAGFSAVSVSKTKYCSKLNVEREMRVAVSNIALRIEVLCRNKRANTSD